MFLVQRDVEESTKWFLQQRHGGLSVCLVRALTNNSEKKTILAIYYELLFPSTTIVSSSKIIILQFIPSSLHGGIAMPFNFVML